MSKGTCPEYIVKLARDVLYSIIQPNNNPFSNQENFCVSLSFKHYAMVSLSKCFRHGGHHGHSN